MFREELSGSTGRCRLTANRIRQRLQENYKSWRGSRFNLKGPCRDRSLDEDHSPPCEGGVDATSRKSCEASFDGADGVVTYEPSCNEAFRNPACERPPRLRRFGGFAALFLV